MKKLLFLFCSFISLSFLISCGDDKFESYDSEFGGASKYQILLPSEITKIYTDNSGTSVSSKTTYTYDIDNRLINISTVSPSATISQAITYNEADDNVKSISTSLNNIPSETYTYEYPSETKILEHTFISGVKGLTNTLTINSSKRLISKVNPSDSSTISFKYDSRGNILNSGDNVYTYDTTKGFMSSAKTPYWIFQTLNEDIPGAYNLVYNVVLAIEKDKDGNTITTVFENKEFNHSEYPVKIITNEGTNEGTIEIKYISAPKK